MTYIFSMNHECKICKDNKHSIENPLINPCKCDGSIKYVHRHCLDLWVKSSNTEKCPECQSVYAKTKTYIGIFSSGLTELIEWYNQQYLMYYKLPLVILSGSYVFWMIIKWLIVHPLLSSRLTLFSLFYYIFLKYIIFYAVSCMICNRRDYKKLLLYMSTIVNVINVMFTQYHRIYFPYTGIQKLSEIIVGFTLLNLGIGWLKYYQDTRTIVLFVDRS